MTPGGACSVPVRVRVRPGRGAGVFEKRPCGRPAEFEIVDWASRRLDVFCGEHVPLIAPRDSIRRIKKMNGPGRRRECHGLSRRTTPSPSHDDRRRPSSIRYVPAATLRMILAAVYEAAEGRASCCD